MLGIFGSISFLIALVVGLLAFSAIHYVPILAIIFGGFITARVAGGFLRGIIAGMIIGVIMAAVVRFLPTIGDWEPEIFGWGAAKDAEVSWVKNIYFSYAVLGGIGGVFAGIGKRI